MPRLPVYCNCPDATGIRRGVPGARSISNAVPRDWSANFAGVREKGGYCKHELRAIVERVNEGIWKQEILDELLQSFNDLPSPPTPKYQPDYRPKLQPNPSRGDDFGYQLRL